MSDVTQALLDLGDTKEQVIATIHAMGGGGRLSNAFESCFGQYLTKKMNDGKRYGVWSDQVATSVNPRETYKPIALDKNKLAVFFSAARTVYDNQYKYCHLGK